MNYGDLADPKDIPGFTSYADAPAKPQPEPEPETPLRNVTPDPDPAPDAPLRNVTDGQEDDGGWGLDF